jgi:hypothetical protein
MAVETVQQITRPPEFIESEAKLYLDQLRNAIGGLKGADLSQIYGSTICCRSRSFTLQAISAQVVLGAYEPYLQSAAASAGPNCISTIYVSISTRCYWILL